LATFDDTVDYTGSLAPYGGQHRRGIRKDIQRSLDKNHGDTVSVHLILDTDRAYVAGSDQVSTHAHTSASTLG
jgi:hypothetical protein